MGKKSPRKLARRVAARIAKNLGMTGSFKDGFKGYSTATGLTGINRTAITLDVKGGDIHVTFSGFLGEPMYRTYRGDDPAVMRKMTEALEQFNDNRVVLI
jgi:hypothetical protein